MKHTQATRAMVTRSKPLGLVEYFIAFQLAMWLCLGLLAVSRESSNGVARKAIESYRTQESLLIAAAAAGDQSGR